MSKFLIIWYDVEFIEVGSKKILKNGYKMTINCSVTRSRAPHESCASKHTSAALATMTDTVRGRGGLKHMPTKKFLPFFYFKFF